MYSSCEFPAPWGLVLLAFPGSLTFHVVTSGRCWLEVQGSDPRLVQPGDLALVPHGEGHCLASEPGVVGVALFDVPRDDVSERFEILRQGGGGTTTRLVCGTANFEHPAARHLVSLLPRAMAVDASRSHHSEWIQSTLRVMASESKELRPGRETVITRLSDVLVIHAIREWIEHDPAAQTGGSQRFATSRWDERSPSSIATRRIPGRSGRWHRRRRCRGRRSRRGSHRWSVCRRCGTSCAGACTRRRHGFAPMSTSLCE
jgi:hypothetical protein